MLTVEMHKFYQSENSDAQNFEDLPDYIKYSNYKQADFLVKILSELGYDIVDDVSPLNAVDSFNEDEIEYIAEREHNAWYKLKVNLGWRYDSVRDEDSKLSPNIVEWEKLDVSQKDSNKRTYRNLPQLCRNVDLKIVRN